MINKCLMCDRKLGVCMFTSNCYIALYHPLCALATCYPGLTGWRIQGWCSSALSGVRRLFVHRFASYIATTGRTQKLGLIEVDVCYESINGGWPTVLSKNIVI